MIKVFIRTEKQVITSITIKDHANFANYGQDLVCAAVSAICFGGANAVDAKGGQVTIGEALIELKNINLSCDDVCFTIVQQLKTVSESYPKYISIKEG